MMYGDLYIQISSKFNKEDNKYYYFRKKIPEPGIKP